MLIERNVRDKFDGLKQDGMICSTSEAVGAEMNTSQEQRIVSYMK